MICLHPHEVQTLDGTLAISRCGRCRNCRQTRQASWIARLLLEQSVSGSANFVTLTYDQENVPDELDYTHIQSFLKRLRKNTLSKIRYYCCGEYGKKTGRPHWHLITFQKLDLSMFSQELTEAWQRGFTQVSSQRLTKSEMSYTTKYLWKDNGSLSRMSRRPGLGLPPLFNIGKSNGREYPLQGRPGYIVIQGAKYPLDRAMQEAYKRGVEKSGGQVVQPTSRIATDLRLRKKLNEEGPDFYIDAAELSKLYGENP